MNSSLAQYKVREGSCGQQLSLRSQWYPSIREVMLRRGITELSLNSSLGWPGGSVEFINELDFLTGLEIIDQVNVSDVSPIHSLADLEHLSINTYCTTPVDFHKFPKLRSCFIQWRKGAESVFESKTITSLGINCYRVGNLLAVRNMTQLEELWLASNSSQSLEGLQNLSHLKTLTVGWFRNLKDIEALRSLKELEQLEINWCRKLQDVDAIAELKNLKILQLCDNRHIATLLPLVGLPLLEDVLFYGSTVIDDGDMSVLMTLPNLRQIAFANRRHYSHKCEDFPACFASPRDPADLEAEIEWISNE